MGPTDGKLSWQEFMEMMRKSPEKKGREMPEEEMRKLFQSVAGKDGMVDMNEFVKMAGEGGKGDDMKWCKSNRDCRTKDREFRGGCCARSRIIDGSLQN